MTALVPFRLTDRDAVGLPSRSLRREMDRLFEDFFGDGAPFEGSTWPAMEVVETKENLLVRAEVPGLDPKEVDISVTGDVLTISGERKEEVSREEANFHVAERRYGQFRRSFRLPAWADPNRIDASSRNGVLEIAIGKREESRPRSVKVKTA